MNKNVSANGHAHFPCSSDGAKLSHTSNVKSNNVNCPAPYRAQKSSNSDGLDHNRKSTLHIDGSSPVTAFSRSFGGSHAATSLNVYSMSPRNTSVMYHYYTQPKGFYENQTPLAHSPSRSNGHYCTSDHSNATKKRDLSRTTSECCESSNNSNSQQVLKGIPQVLYNDVLEDPRRRAWSESDSNRKSNMHMSRMSALKKFKMKLSRNGSLKKRKDEGNHRSNDSLDRSAISTSSAEVADEKHFVKNSSACSSQRSTVIDIDVEQFGSLSVRDDSTATTNSGDSPSVSDRTSSVFDDSSASQDIELIYQRFLEEHTCYDIMPTSSKLLVFDTRLQAHCAFHSLIENAVRSAPLWDAKVSCYVGMLTVTDFIKVILIAHEAENMKVESIENETIDTWRKLLDQQSSFASVHPDDTLLHTLKILINEHFHGVPVMDGSTGDIFHVINYKRILRFLHLFTNELPMPEFMGKTLGEIRIGTYKNVTTVNKRDTMLHVLRLFAGKKLTAIPVVDQDGEVVDVFCKLDMIPLAAQGLYHNLSTTIEVALACRFKPLFEDEECPDDAFTRFSSPRPQRRDMNLRRSYRTGNDVKSPNDRRKSNEHSRHNLQVTARGHYITPSPKAHRKTAPDERSRPHSYHQTSFVPEAAPVTHDCAEHPVRHRSLSNPLVKCRLTDSLQQIIDLMVNTEANLLVVVGQKSNHVIGVVTVSDALHYIVNPQGHVFDQSSPPRRHRSSQIHPPSSLGSESSSSRDSASPPRLNPVSHLHPNSSTPSGGSDRHFASPARSREVLISNL